jgi:hypothetical protein
MASRLGSGAPPGVAVRRDGRKLSQPRCMPKPASQHHGQQHHGIAFTCSLFFHILRGAVHACPSPAIARLEPSRSPLPALGDATDVCDKLPTRPLRARGMLDTGQTLIHHDEYKDDAS